MCKFRCILNVPPILSPFKTFPNIMHSHSGRNLYFSNLHVCIHSTGRFLCPPTSTITLFRLTHQIGDALFRELTRFWHSDPDWTLGSLQIFSNNKGTFIVSRCEESMRVGKEQNRRVVKNQSPYSSLKRHHPRNRSLVLRMSQRRSSYTPRHFRGEEGIN